MSTNSNDWISYEDKDASIWQGGFSSTELINKFASGSYGSGQIADILNTDSDGTWPVASHRTRIIQPKLSRNEVSAGWIAVTVLSAEPDEETDVVISTAEKIELVRDGFGVSISQLAKILRTSRPSIYSWLEGEIPREQYLQRIEKIFNFAKYWTEINPYHFSPGPILRQPLGGLPSMLEQLEQEELHSDEIKVSLTLLLDLMHQKRRRMDRSKRFSDNSQINEIEKSRHRRSLTRTVGSSD